MGVETSVIVAVTLVTSVLLTRMMIKFALSRNLLDVPNERSSHQVPTPRGGGVAMAVSATAGLVILSLVNEIQSDLLIALVLGGAAVAAVGFLDDRYQLSAAVRLTVHFMAAVGALIWLGGLPPLRIGEHIVAFGWIGYFLGALGIVWTVNLFNFMDGIDGLAASECIFIAIAGAFLAVISETSNSAPTMIVFAASICGFLVWNWPPAKIFMGDVGSGYLGYVIGVLAIAEARENPAALFVWLILGAVFFMDATVTLVRRLARRERAHEAHSSHAYQWLARGWKSHKRVTVAVLLINVFWLFPCALLATLYPKAAAWIVCAALIPVGIAAIVAGAGRAETKQLLGS